MRAPLPPIAARLLMFTPPIVYCAWLWWLSSGPVHIPGGANDLLVHFLAYGVLGALFTRAFWFTSDWSLWRVGLYSWLWAAGYGVVDEFHQSFVAGRHASVLDGLADAAGALAGVIVLLGAYWWTKQRLGPSGA
ncbi:MAG: VanZ family protein [Myxococcales bacterium]|nr:VanZ family protein [Myxococcales bacterium]